LRFRFSLFYVDFAQAKQKIITREPDNQVLLGGYPPDPTGAELLPGPKDLLVSHRSPWGRIITSEVIDGIVADEGASEASPGAWGPGVPPSSTMT